MPFAGFALTFLLAMPAPTSIAPPAVRHYVFFGFERERIAEPSFLDQPAFEGAQLKFSWRELEPRRDVYDFATVESALALLDSHGKRLWIQLQETSFDPQRVLVPEYLVEDPRFGGGVAPQYEIEDEEETRYHAAGWVARRWDPAVRERFAMLLQALGRAFDGRIAGINLPESSVGFGERGPLQPPDYTAESYRDGLIANLVAARRAFTKSVVLQYLNFMPGEWLPWIDHGLLRSVYEFALANGVALGGPDLLPHKKGQMNNGYRFLIDGRGRLLVGIAVQEGNERHVDPSTGERVTPASLLAFARDELGASILFWGAHEPFYSEELLPFIAAGGAR